MTANYAEAHQFHIVTTATLPSGLAAVAGAGTYTNGQTGTFSAPLAVTNTPPDYYAFRRFTLNGVFHSSSANFQKIFSTTDPTNMHFVAEYEWVDRTPLSLGPITVTTNVASALIAWTTDEPTRARIEYGPTTIYSHTNSTAALLTSHSFYVAGLAPATLYHFRVMVSDAAGNQTVTPDHTFTTLAPPDLAPGAVSAPALAEAGTTVPMSFVISNLGPGAAFGLWQNNILISRNRDGAGAQSLGTVSFNPGPLGLVSSATLVVTQRVIVPSVETGQWYFGVTLDSDDRLVELNETNNTAFAEIPFTTAACDLRVARLTAPATASFGQSIDVEFSVTNAGTAAVSVPWVDRVYLSATSNTLGRLLATASASSVPLASGADYGKVLKIDFPLDESSIPGLYYLVVMADAENVSRESDETNNSRSSPITLTMPPLPDLAVENVLAPTNTRPGQLLSLTYAVTNRGTASAAPMWSETVYLATNQLGHGAVELLTLVFTNELPPAAALVRTQTLILPSLPLTGDLWFLVKVDSRDRLIELHENNNAAVAAGLTFVPGALTLQLSLDRVSEDAVQPIMATLQRNGDVGSALTVNLTSSDPTEISIPTTVVIPERQSYTTFGIRALGDGLVDGPQLVVITASAQGFEQAFAEVTVLDADLPRLVIALAAGTAHEGETVSGTVTCDSGTEALQVQLTSSSSGQLILPSLVIIPAGETQTVFEIAVADDLLIEPALTVGLQAVARGYQAGSASLTVLDNDWPELTLSIEPSVFGEGAGPQAAQARLVRSPVSPRPVEVDLVNSNTNAIQVPHTVTIPAGQAEVTFAVAAVDNDMVDDDKHAYIDPWFKAHIFGALLGKGKTAHVIVRDDDGPTLRLEVNRRIVAEGLSPAATLTLSRNAGTNMALVVNLASDSIQELVVPQNATLDAGVWSVSVPVNSVNDGVSDGNKTVTLTASTAGFAPGTAQLVVTDVDMPDLVVRALQAPAQGETEAYANIGYEIYNQGLANATSNTVVQRVYLSTDPLVGDDVLVGQFPFSGPLPMGAHFGQTIPVRLPQAAGDYWVVVETDSTDAIVETLEDNNRTISTGPLRVVPAYVASVSTSIETAPAGSPVPMTGRAVKSGGGPAPFALVSIHIRVRDTIRTIAALTDAKGDFSTTWQPLAGEAGCYQISAGHPGDVVPPAQDSFYLLGMKSVPSEPRVSVTDGASVTGSMKIENLSDVALSGLQALVTSQPPNLQATLTISTNVLAGSGTAELGYSVSALDASSTAGVIDILVSSAEGAVLILPLQVTIKTRVPRLIAIPDRLEAGAQCGAQRIISFQLANVGGWSQGRSLCRCQPCHG